MSHAFALAGGSMIGRDHRAVPKNNQDSWGIWQSATSTVAIVADGCGSGRHSEVGAKLGVNLLGAQLHKMCIAGVDVNWRQAQQMVLSHLDVLARAMGDDYRKVIEDYFLFTLVGVVIDLERAVFFALGDGLIVINGEFMPLGPYPGNMPPYIGYNLMSDKVTINTDLLQLQPVVDLSSAELQSFMIATDGVEDVVSHEMDCLPGLNRPVGLLSDFWQRDRYFQGNPELLSRQLKLIGRDWPANQPQPGLTSDDTTIIVGRRQDTERTER